MLNILKNTINRVFASGVDSDASAFITATGLSGTTQKSAITTLVKDLKASGLWSKMKAVYPMVTDNRNLFSYSEDFTNAFWVKNNSTVTSNSATAPDGTTTADTLIPIAGTNIDNTVVFALMDTASQTRTLSFYAKSAGYNYAYARIGGATPVALALFDLSNGTVVQTQAPAISASIESVGNGWYRCQMAYPNSPSLYAPNIGACSSTYTISSTGITTTTNGTSGIYIWGAQLEASSTASTYQPIATTPSAFMASQMKYNLKDARDLDAAFRLTWSGGWTYSATGATPNGTNAYADTKLNQTAAGMFTNSHLSYYSRTNSTTATAQVEMGVGATVAGTFTNLLMRLDTVTNYIGGSIGSRNALSTSANSNGHLIVNALSAAAKAFKNGVLVATDTTTQTGILNTLPIYIGCQNNNSVAGQFSSRQAAFASIGDGLSDNDAMLLNQIVEKYQVALSRGVQAAQSFYYNSAYSNEANTYLYSTQITGTTQVSAINTLINGLKANNLWTKMKAVYPFVTDYRNLLGYTEDYSNAVWSKNNSSIAVNQITAPNGTLTGNGLVDNATNAGHSFNNATGITVTANNYTLSVYAKKGNKDWIYLNIYNGTNDAFAWFNLNTGITGTVQSGLTSSIQDAGNGWYRVSITRNLPVTSNCYVQYGASNTDNSTTFVGTGTYNIYLWGTQFELGTLSNYQQVLTTSANYMSNQMKFNMANPQDSDAAFRLAFSGGWTYSTNGAQPNGTNGYADTKLVPSTALSSQNSQHYSLYSLTNIAEAKYGFGSDDVRMALKWSDNILYAKLGTSEYGYGVNSSSLGMHIMSRIDTSNVPLYIRNSKINVASATTSLSALNILLGARKLSASIDSYGSRQTAFASIGDGLTDAEAAMLYQIVQQFQTDLSRQV